MSNVGQSFNPGDVVPESGIYSCTGCNGTMSFSTDVHGHRFPPSHCHGGKWRLVERTPNKR
jgi:hypothetical protein